MGFKPDLALRRLFLTQDSLRALGCFGKWGVGSQVAGGLVPGSVSHRQLGACPPCPDFAELGLGQGWGLSWLLLLLWAGCGEERTQRGWGRGEGEGEGSPSLIFCPTLLAPHPPASAPPLPIPPSPWSCLYPYQAPLAANNSSFPR